MSTNSIDPCLSPKFDEALRWATKAHEGQFRRGNGVPYVQHVVAVAWVLERAGFDEEVVVAGLLHDIVEDTEATSEEVARRFGPRVGGLVDHCSEVKLDEEGRKRPWIDRKRDHLAALADAPRDAKAIILADKLHNLHSIRQDLMDGLDAWSGFNAPKDRVLWYYGATIEACGNEDPRVHRLAVECRLLLDSLMAGGIIPSEN